MTSTVKRSGITRRQFSARAAGALATLGLGGVGGYELRERTRGAAPEPTGPTASTVPSAGNPGSGVATFVSRPDLRPVEVRITSVGAARDHAGPGSTGTGSGSTGTDAGRDRAGSTGGGTGSSPRFIVMAPMADIPYRSVQRGPMLIDRQGRLIWYRPGPDSAFDAQVQEYEGKPVLTWWHGEIVDGYGVGVAEILDESYRTVATVGNAKTLPLDLHEFNLTSRGTVLATHYETRTADLSSVGGSRQGLLLVGHALEIEVATNKVLFDWVSADHVALDESYEDLPGSSKTPYDFFHINSIAEAPDGNLLISGRNTCCIYKVDRRTGAVIWRLHGKRSDFKVPADAAFSWQHHVRPHGSSEITLFDNATYSPRGSLALMLHVDEHAKQVSLTRAFQHPNRMLAQTLGSVQVRPDGNVFVGWGSQPYFSEFSADGELLVTGQFDSDTRSYRTFLADWTGRPTQRPTIVARANSAGGFIVYVSWNGATEVDHWTVLAGSDAGSLKQVGWQPWTGFETGIVVNSTGPIFQVAAIDRDGNELGRSEVT